MLQKRGIFLLDGLGNKRKRTGVQCLQLPREALACKNRNYLLSFVSRDTPIP